MDYGDTVYCTTSEYNLSQLQMLQNSACRSILLRERDSSIAEMHQDFSILTLAQRRQLHMSVDCQKGYYGQGPYSTSRFFTPVANVCQRQTRATSTKEVIVPIVKNSMGGKAYRYRGPVFWNALQDSMRSIENHNEFKRHVSISMSQANVIGNQNFPT